jgi:hypothetical protein
MLALSLAICCLNCWVLTERVAKHRPGKRILRAKRTSARGQGDRQAAAVGPAFDSPLCACADLRMHVLLPHLATSRLQKPARFGLCPWRTSSGSRGGSSRCAPGEGLAAA